MSTSTTTSNSETLAKQLGTTTHLSPLLMKAKRLSLSSPEDLEQLAIQRGCRYYAQAGDTLRAAEESPKTDGIYTRKTEPVIGEAEFTNAELAVALLSICLPKSQHRLRMGACMLGAPGITTKQIVHLAKQERVGPVVRHIAECGHKVEPHLSFWKELRDQLGNAPVKADVLPHITRFVAMTGITRRGKETVMQWIRPAKTNRRLSA